LLSIKHAFSPILFAVLFILFIFAGLPRITISADDTVKQKDNPYAKVEITIKIIPSAKNTFGYDILVYGRPLVHQPSIPGLPGNEGFKTEEKARKVAELVVRKIRNSEMPPTVTIGELNGMGVLK